MFDFLDPNVDPENCYLQGQPPFCKLLEGILLVVGVEVDLLMGWEAIAAARVAIGESVSCGMGRLFLLYCT